MSAQGGDALQIFIDESLEHLADIENDLLAIETAGADIDEERVNKVFRAAHCPPADRDDALVHPDEMMEGAEGDEILGLIAAATAGEHDVVPLQRSAGTAPGNGTAPVVTVEHLLFSTRAKSLGLCPGMSRVVAED